MGLQQDIQNNPTVFGAILRGEIPADKVYEDEHIFAFKDIAPKAKVHVLVIPKKRICCLGEATSEDAELLGYLTTKIPDIAAIVGIKESGFRIIINSGDDAEGEVPHLHYHILGGQNLGVNILPNK